MGEAMPPNTASKSENSQGSKNRLPSDTQGTGLRNPANTEIPDQMLKAKNGMFLGVLCLPDASKVNKVCCCVNTTATP